MLVRISICRLFRCRRLSAKLDPSLNLFADVVLNPSFPEKEVEREQKLVLVRRSNGKRTLRE